MWPEATNGEHEKECFCNILDQDRVAIATNRSLGRQVGFSGTGSPEFETRLSVSSNFFKLPRNSPKLVMQDLTQARREAFCRYIAARGGRRAVITANSLTVSEVSYLSQLIGANAKTVFGERAARNWEDRLGMQGNPLLFPHETRLAHAADPASVSRILEDLVAAVGTVAPEDRMAVIEAVSALISNPTAVSVAGVVSLISNNVAPMRAQSQQMGRGNSTDLRARPEPALA